MNANQINTISYSQVIDCFNHATVGFKYNQDNFWFKAYEDPDLPEILVDLFNEYVNTDRLEQNHNEPMDPSTDPLHRPYPIEDVARYLKRYFSLEAGQGASPITFGFGGWANWDPKKVMFIGREQMRDPDFSRRWYKVTFKMPTPTRFMDPS